MLSLLKEAQRYCEEKRQEKSIYAQLKIKIQEGIKKIFRRYPGFSVLPLISKDEAQRLAHEAKRWDLAQQGCEMIQDKNVSEGLQWSFKQEVYRLEKSIRKEKYLERLEYDLRNRAKNSASFGKIDYDGLKIVCCQIITKDYNVYSAYPNVPPLYDTFFERVSKVICRSMSYPASLLLGIKKHLGAPWIGAGLLIFLKAPHAKANKIVGGSLAFFEGVCELLRYKYNKLKKRIDLES